MFQTAVPAQLINKFLVFTRFWQWILS